MSEFDQCCLQRHVDIAMDRTTMYLFHDVRPLCLLSGLLQSHTDVQTFTDDITAAHDADREDNCLT